MVPVARRNLLAEPTRLLISVGGVALAVLIILVILSLYQGFRQAFGSFVARVPADVWVAQYGSSDLFHSTSLLPAELGPRLAAMDGVESAAPVLGRRAKIELRGDSGGIFLFAPDSSRWGPGAIAVEAGKPLPGPGEAVVDVALARKYGLRVGEQLPVGARSLTIAGMFSGGNVAGTQFVLMTPQDAADLFGRPGLVNYFLVTANGGWRAEAVAEAISGRMAEVSAFTRQTFVENNRREVTAIFLPIVAVLVFIAFIVGTAVIGLTIYTATLERAQEFAVLKAIGASPGFLYRIIWAQSLGVALGGFAVGLAATAGVDALASRVVPEFVTVLRWQDALWVLGGTALMSLAAGYLPVRRVAALDPALVFRA